MKKDVYERLLAEEKELKEKLTKLNAFMEMPAFKELDEENRGLLIQQSIFMKYYLKTLQRRIEINNLGE